MSVQTVPPSTTAALMTEYEAATRVVETRASADLVRAWRGMDSYADVDRVRRLYGPQYLAVIAYYGSAVEALAAVVTSELLGQKAAAAGAAAVLAPERRIEAATVSLRWALGPLYGDLAKVNPEDALTLIRGAGTRHVLAPGRETMIGAAAKATVRFERVVHGSNACEWCKMLAGRGAVYHTEESAGMLSQWHDACKCSVRLVE